MTQRTGANREMDEWTDEGTLIITELAFKVSTLYITGYAFLCTLLLLGVVVFSIPRVVKDFSVVWFLSETWLKTTLFGLKQVLSNFYAIGFLWSRCNFREKEMFRQAQSRKCRARFRDVAKTTCGIRQSNYLPLLLYRIPTSTPHVFLLNIFINKTERSIHFYWIHFLNKILTWLTREYEIDIYQYLGNKTILEMRSSKKSKMKDTIYNSC
jgi:hypothetical protein